MPPNKASHKRGTRSKQPWEKMEAITRVRAGESKAAVARSIDVPESTLRGWCKNAEKIESTTTTRPSSTSPTSGTSSDGSKKATLQGTASPQNLSVLNGIPPGPPEINVNYPGIVDLSMPSPQASSSGRADNSIMMQQAQEFNNYYQAARLNQMVQAIKHAQDLTLRYDLAGNSGSSMLATTASGAANLPNARMPPEESVRQWLNATIPSSQISPNSSGATLSTPQHNGQHTTSPIAGSTPEQQNMYLEWCRALMMSRLGGPFSMPMPSTSAPALPRLYSQLMPNNSEHSATESHPATPRQPISALIASNEPREEIEVPEMQCEEEAQKPGSPLSSETPQDDNDLSLVVDLSSPQARSRRSRSINGETSAQSPNTADQSSIADQSSTMQLQSENSMNENGERKVPARKRKHASLENIVSGLREGAVVDGDEEDQVAPNNIQECIDSAENFLSALQRNSSHPSVTGFHVRQVKAIIDSYKNALEISPKKKRRQE